MKERANERTDECFGDWMSDMLTNNSFADFWSVDPLTYWSIYSWIHLFLTEPKPRKESVLQDVPENTDGIDFSFHRSESRMERRDSLMDGQPFRRKRADSLSVVTIDTADLDCQFTIPDEQHEDKIIEEEKSETGRVRL